MTTTLLGIVVAVSPFAAVVGLLRLANWIGRRREANSARQIALTDAIHRELGAAAAPTVRRPLRGGWLVTMMVPVDQPRMVAALVRITERTFASAGDAAAKRLRIVLVPQAPPPAATVGASRPLGRPAPVAPALR